MSENRKSSYKFGSKNADARRKNRQETSVALRKTAREVQFMERRKKKKNFAWVSARYSYFWLIYK